MGRGVAMSQPTQQETITEIYRLLTQLITAYAEVMDTFGTVVVSVTDVEKTVADLEEFIEHHCIDAITGRTVWQHTAKLHKEEAERLRLQVELLTAAGHRFGIDIPIPIKAAAVDE
jgi:hypothetical protein